MIYEYDNYFININTINTGKSFLIKEISMTMEVEIKMSKNVSHAKGLQNQF